jgi:hypothetical protein
MYFLNTDTIIALYAIGGRPNIELFSIDNGKTLNNKQILLPYHLVYAENDRIYLVKQSNPGEKLHNPQLLVYSMNKMLRE